MKKKLSVLVVVLALMLTSILPTSAIASNNFDNSSDDIFDSKYLVSASVDRFEFSRTIPLGSPVSINSLASSQMFVTEKVVVIPENETAANEIISILAGGNSKKISPPDVTGTITLWTDVYYTTVIGWGGATYVDMYRIDGGYTILSANGSTVAGSYRAYSQVGIGASGSNQLFQTVQATSTTAKEWSLYPPSSWEAVLPGTLGEVGVTYNVTLQRPGGHQWTTANLVNHIA